MAKKIEKADMRDVMRDKYMIYAKSTIIDRSFPFIDGYKPVQRKVLYDMHELGLDKKQVKSARIVGDTMGKYHPHGDCCRSSTKLYLANGQVLTLEDAYRGQKEVEILAVDIKKKKIVPAKAHSFRIGQYTNKIYKISFTNGSYFECTANHPILMKNYKYKKAEDIKIGDDVFSEPFRVDSGRPFIGQRRIQDIVYGWVRQNGYSLYESTKSYELYKEFIKDKENQDYYNISEEELNTYIKDYYNKELYVTKIEIEEVDQEPMYDFTVDKYENMLIPMIGNDAVSFISIHNSSIYGAICQMADTVEGRNAPEVQAHGCFGRIWSIYTIPPAAMRYTEAKLTKLASECLFDGLNANAVDYVENFDNTLDEPVLLPVKYPNIIVNTSSGVACGIKTYIPSYTLKNACEAVIGLLDGSINTPEDLVDVLDAPDFQTGGIVNMSHEQKMDLVKLGATRGVYITSRYTVDEKKNELVIYEIPYNTNCEKIVTQIGECIKDRKINGLTRVVNGSDKNGLGIVVYYQRGYTAEEIFKYLCAYTDVQTKISFQTKFVHIDKVTGEMNYKEVGIYSLLKDYWIPWRIDVIKRMKQFELDKLEADLHKAKAWDIVGDRIREYVDILLDNNKKEAREIHMQTFNIDEIQEDALISNYIESLTLDGVLRMRDKIKKLEEEVLKLKNFISNEKAIGKQIIEEQKKIIKKYGIERKSSSEEFATLVHLTREEATAVRDEEVWVGITEKCKLKKALTEKDADNFESKLEKDDALWVTYPMNNKDSLLVFTTAGYIYKLPVNALDSSARTQFKDSAWRFISKDPGDMHELLDRKSDIFYISPLGKGKDGFNIVYRRGLLKKIRYDMYTSKRKVYKKAFPEYEDTGFIIDYDEMLLVTNKGRAIIWDVSNLNDIDNPTKGQMVEKFPKLRDEEEIIAVYNLDDIKPYLTEELIERYRKRYWIKAKRGAYDITSILAAYDKKVRESEVSAKQETVEEEINEPVIDNEAE